MVLSGCVGVYCLLSSREVEVESRSQNNKSRFSSSFNGYKWDSVGMKHGKGNYPGESDSYRGYDSGCKAASTVLGRRSHCGLLSERMIYGEWKIIDECQFPHILKMILCGR